MNTESQTHLLTDEQLAAHSSCIVLTAKQKAFLNHESPFKTWQDCYPNQIRIKLNQSELLTLSEIGFFASFQEQHFINQFVLREYFTGDIFRQLSEFSQIGSYKKRNVYFKISTALALIPFLESNSDRYFLTLVAKEIKSALAKQVSIKL
jgi:hypothetical protein